MIQASFSSVRNGSVLRGFFVFLSVFAAVFVLKYDFIANQIMILDDLTFYYRAKIEDARNLHDTLPIASMIYYITAKLSPNISYQVLMYVLMISISSVFVFLWLSRYFVHPLILISGILFSFTSPAVASMANFVSGSHGMVGFMFASLGLLLSSRSVDPETYFARRITLASGAGVSFVLAALSSPFFHIFFLSVVFYILMRYEVRDFRDRMVWIPTIITIFPPLFCLLYNMTQGLYHYSVLEGWTDYTALHMLERSWEYAHYVAALYKQGSMISWMTWCAAGICIGVLYACMKMNSALRCKIDFERKENTTTIVVILSGFVLTLIPILPSTFHYAPRYLFPSMVMATIAIFFILDLMARRSRRFYRTKWIPILLICVLLGYNFSTTHAFQTGRYGDLIRYQPMLSDFVHKERTNWLQRGQVIIASDIPGSFTVGYNHWSTGFLRIHSGDETIVGLIGREDWMDDEAPFVEFYRHHHVQYWKTIQREASSFSTRRKMFGLVKSRPTYAYRFNSSGGGGGRARSLASGERAGFLAALSDDRRRDRLAPEGRPDRYARRPGSVGYRS